MPDLNIAIISWAFTNLDAIGEGVEAYELAYALSKHGICVEVFCQRASIEEWERMKNISLHILPWGGKKYSARFLLETLARLVAARRKIDLIHQLQYEKTFLPYFGKPYILSGHVPYEEYLKLRGRI